MDVRRPGGLPLLFPFLENAVFTRISACLGRFDIFLSQPATTEVVEDRDPNPSEGGREEGKGGKERKRATRKGRSAQSITN